MIHQWLRGHINVPETTVSACDGSPVIAIGVGEVSSSTTVNGSSHFVTFREVLHVPTLVCNLFSQGKADAQGADIRTKYGRLAVFVDSKVILTGTKHQGLFVLDVKAEKTFFSLVKSESAKVWHQRFGPLGYNNLAKIVEGQLVSGISVASQEFKEEGSKVCDVCVLSKQAQNLLKS
jgi:hypothetical protein